VNDALNRLHVAMPTPRDNKERPSMIPESVVKAKQMSQTDIQEKKPTEEEEQQPFWLRGFNDQSAKKKYQLDNPEWRFDSVPEIIDGKNIADYIDPEILQRLEELEKEEEEREAAEGDVMDDEDDFELTEEQIATVKKIRERRKITAKRHSQESDKNRPTVPRTKSQGQDLSDFESHLVEMGINPNTAVERIRERSRSRSQSRVGRKRSRSESAMDVDGKPEKKQKNRGASKTPARSDMGLKDAKQKQHVEKLARFAMKKRNKEAKKGEGDRHIYDLKPKHLYSGQRGMGKTERR